MKVRSWRLNHQKMSLINQMILGMRSRLRNRAWICSFQRRLTMSQVAVAVLAEENNHLRKTLILKINSINQSMSMAPMIGIKHLQLVATRWPSHSILRDKLWESHRIRVGLIKTRGPKTCQYAQKKSIRDYLTKILISRPTNQRS